MTQTTKSRIETLDKYARHSLRIALAIQDEELKGAVETITETLLTLIGKTMFLKLMIAPPEMELREKKDE